MNQKINKEAFKQTLKTMIDNSDLSPQEKATRKQQIDIAAAEADMVESIAHACGSTLDAELIKLLGIK